MDGIQDLGLRIVQAARLAVAVHLYESVARHTDPAGEVSRVAKEILRRRVATGGAGLNDDANLDGELLPSPAQSRLGDLVTDDEWDGLMGHDDGEEDRAAGAAGAAGDELPDDDDDDVPDGSRRR
jgi:hypothetical protein